MSVAMLLADLSLQKIPYSAVKASNTVTALYENCRGAEPARRRPACNPHKNCSVRMLSLLPLFSTKAMVLTGLKSPLRNDGLPESFC